MPSRKTYRRKRYARKKTYRKRFNRRVRYSKRGQKLYLFKRYTGALGPITISNISPTLLAFNFSLSDVPDVTDFTKLYDMYKLNCVKISFIPQMDTNVSLGSLNNPVASARFFSAIDYNDGTAPLNVDELRQYSTCKMTPILRKHKRVIYKPKILDTSGYSTSPWMSTSYNTADYYGLKVAIEPMLSTTTTSMTYSVECVYYMSFKKVK